MKFYILTFYLLINEVFYCSQVCKKYFCSQLNEGTCIVTQEDTDQFTLQKCEDPNQFCPFMNLSNNNQVRCITRDGFHPRSFPGGDCTNDSECITGNCQLGICSGKRLNEECRDNMECYSGYYCQNNSKTCQAQSKEGEMCEDDTDCINTHGCHYGKCIGYLSLPIGTQIDANQKNLLPLCQSGLHYGNRCESMTNNGKNPNQCDDTEPCKYKINDGSIVHIPEFCTCGKNPTGLKYCRLGNGESEWSDYLGYLKLLLKNTNNCHTLERGFCMFHLRESNEILQKFLIARAKALKYNELINADDCVLKIFFPDVNS